MSAVYAAPGEPGAIVDRFVCYAARCDRCSFDAGARPDWRGAAATFGRRRSRHWWRWWLHEQPRQLEPADAYHGDPRRLFLCHQLGALDPRRLGPRADLDHPGRLGSGAGARAWRRAGPAGFRRRPPQSTSAAAACGAIGPAGPQVAIKFEGP